jgi:hypothetical protein
MKTDKIVDSKITTMTDLSGNKSKVLLLKNETGIEAFKEQLRLCSVSTRTFRFSGMKDGEKFVKEIQAPDRESAIADFELTYPDLTWRFSTDIT